MSSEMALPLAGGEGAAVDAVDARPPVLSTLPAGRGERLLALAVVAISAVVFAAAAPFAKVPLAQVPAFLPIYQSALIVNDLITAVLLFGQFRIRRSSGLLVLGSGYLFCAFMAVLHVLSFPGLFSPTGLLGAGGQTTAWLYFIWHGVFPVLVIVYALQVDERAPTRRSRAGAGFEIACGAAVALAVALAFMVLTTVGHELLPVIMRGDQDASAKFATAAGTWVLSLAALAFLWRRRPHAVIDLWLMVAMCVWIFDVALASVLNAGRYDLGWYAGRVYGLLAASFVLTVLLFENSMLYSRLAESSEAERARAANEIARHAERLRILHEIDRAILAELSPQAIAGAVIVPLRELLDVPRAIVNVFDLPAGQVEWLAAAGRHRTHAGPAVRYSISLMGDLAALQRGEPQVIDTRALPPGPEVEALLASGVKFYTVVPMISGAQLIGALSFGGETASFPEEQLSIAQEVAAQLAIAISQARLLERVKRHADELETRVRQRTSDLEAANRELEAFSYSVSHDLRAPLRAVDGYAQMLAEDYGTKLDEEGRRLLGVVRDSASHMGQLIDDLLKFSQVGRRPLALAPLDMRALASEVVAEASARHPKAHVELDALPAAMGDRATLKQVWVNLVGNALKYSSKVERPRVEIGGRANGSSVEYWVRDNGAGFDARYAEKLFGVFQRLHREDEFEGTGVGLAIVQRVVARHGGRVSGEGAVGQGACFRFTLPKEG